MDKENTADNKDDIAYLLLLRDAFAKIRDFTAGMSYEVFFSDSKTQSAVIMQLQVVGELAKKMPESIKNSIDIPWKQMAGLRDIVSHDYFSLDLESVWQTAEQSVFDAEAKVRSYLETRTIHS